MPDVEIVKGYIPGSIVLVVELEVLTTIKALEIQVFSLKRR